MELIKTFEGNNVEIIELNGQILFNARDVGKCLGMTGSAIRNHVSMMNSNQVVKVKNSDVRNQDIRKLNNAGENFFTESGVYKVTFRSTKPNAEKFTDWVTDEVLPSIRKTGIYAMKETVDKLLNDPDFAIQLFTKIKEEQAANEALKKQNAQQNAQILVMKPKADYCDIILKCPGTVRTTDIAQDYGVSAQVFNRFLHKLGIQYKRGNHWNLSSLYAGYGYAKVESIVEHDKNGAPFDVQHMYWTQSGRRFLYEFLKEHGFLPICEGGNKKDIIDYIKKEKP